jgi:hypothetical protein
MSKTVSDVVRALRVEPGDETERHAELLHDGRGLHVDFGEADQVFLVSVQRIPRRWLTVPSESTVGRIDGTVIAVHSVAIANHLEVTLDAVDAPEVAIPAPSDARPWPGDRVMRKIHVAMSDERSTAYRLVSGEAGGEEHPWRACLRFLPLPPPNATVLDLNFSVGKASQLHMALRLVHAPE